MPRPPKLNPKDAYFTPSRFETQVLATHRRCGHNVFMTPKQAADQYEYCPKCWPAVGNNKPTPRDLEEILTDLFNHIRTLPSRGAVAAAHKKLLELIEEYEQSGGVNYE